MIINVDDLGLSPAVNKAVVLLAEQGRIQSTSFMSLGQVASSDVTTLQQCGVDIGLHLDFTGLASESHDVLDLKQLMLRAWSRRLSVQKVKLMINEQLDLFEDKVGQSPVFVDGHQHVHQFPVIRECLVGLVEKRYGLTVAMRSTLPMQFDLKSTLIYQLGGRVFNRLCQQHNVPINRYFAGAYDFSGDEAKLQQLWSRWLLSDRLSAGGLVMCHPAVPDASWSDPIRLAREREFVWLSSQRFADLLIEKHVVSERWRDILLPSA